MVTVYYFKKHNILTDQYERGLWPATLEAIQQRPDCEPIFSTAREVNERELEFGVYKAEA